MSDFFICKNRLAAPHLSEHPVHVTRGERNKVPRKIKETVRNELLFSHHLFRTDRHTAVLPRLRPPPAPTPRCRTAARLLPAPPLKKNRNIYEVISNGSHTAIGAHLCYWRRHRLSVCLGRYSPVIEWLLVCNKTCKPTSREIYTAADKTTRSKVF